MNQDAPMVPLNFEKKSETQMMEDASRVYQSLKKRRSIRHFSDEAIPLEVVRMAIKAAARAPSGANKQPWSFALVTDPAIKKQIREAAEQEELSFYTSRATQDWLDDLKPFDTDHHKPFLERAPALIVVFSQNQGADGDRHYYVKESVGLATGMLLATLHMSGLATLTHTPSPMGFLTNVLNRPKNERAFLLIPVGYPDEDCQVPDIDKKPPQDFLFEY